MRYRNRRARMARRGIRVSGAQPASREGAIPGERERKAAAVMTIVFFIIGLSVILSYDWGAPTPQFRPDAGLVILLGILISAIDRKSTRLNSSHSQISYA